MITSTDYPDYKVRHVYATRIPKMQRGELTDIIEKRPICSEFASSKPSVASIVGTASGYPHFVHRLALYCCVERISQNAVPVTQTVMKAIVSFFHIDTDISVKAIDWNIDHFTLVAALKQFNTEVEANFEQAAPVSGVGG
jgi:hypothetical protein